MDLLKWVCLKINYKFKFLWWETKNISCLKSNKKNIFVNISANKSTNNLLNDFKKKNKYKCEKKYKNKNKE
jgi:hypothetical protein